jgi:hypothetical protein
MITAPRKAPIGASDKKLLAEQFTSDHGIGCFIESPRGFTITLEAFDIWIIDHGFAQDPGCDEANGTSMEWRGFVAQRNSTRKMLNICGRILEEPLSFSVEINTDPRERGEPITYDVRPWQAHVKLAAGGQAQKILRYTKNKGSALKQFEALAETKGLNGQDTLELQAYLAVVKQSFEHTEAICAPAWEQHEGIEADVLAGMMSLVDTKKLEHDAG